MTEASVDSVGILLPKLVLLQRRYSNADQRIIWEMQLTRYGSGRDLWVGRADTVDNNSAPKYGSKATSTKYIVHTRLHNSAYSCMKMCRSLERRMRY